MKLPRLPAPDENQFRVLVVVVAYHAERHICKVLDRVPSTLLNHHDVHFLILDDASTDGGAASASSWASSRGVTNLTVIRNETNQGYGGNQKLGYRLAIDGGFSCVVLLHGDGQYAPELLPQFINEAKTSRAAVILGSRMASPASALQGGMPLYKLLGNKVLTLVQNVITNARLSEYHTGYRAYSTQFLQRVPFEVNTNAFHFDTEILLQAMYIGAEIREIPIPTHYGDEVCHVNGLRYAWDVVCTTVQYRCHTYGMLCSLKYRDLDPTAGPRTAAEPYTAEKITAGLVKKLKPKKVVDIGSGSPFVTRECLEHGAHIVEIRGPARSPSRRSPEHSYNWVTERLPVDPLSFDLILLLDELEQLDEPERFLINLRNQGGTTHIPGKQPLVLITVPNVAFLTVRLNLLLGRFNYAERGILDIAHKRLFTRKALIRMLRDCGYEVLAVKGAGVPFRAVIGGKVGRAFEGVATALAWTWPTIFGFQFVVLCRPSPGVRQVLQQGKRLMVGIAGPLAETQQQTAGAAVVGQ